jgi:2-amino-4-hydroxy-6-hydroxymethyldihydropteridine diphosphokinase
MTQDAEPSLVAPAGTVSAFIGLGANLGDAAATLHTALRALSGLPATVLAATSSFYRTAPIEANGPDFLNAVAWLHTALPPAELLARLHDIEAAHQRTRPYRNAPRTLDLDLLLHGGACMDTPTLQLPHPRLHQRAFVLWPLAELAPHLDIPGQGALSDLMAAVAAQRIERLPP